MWPMMATRGTGSGWIISRVTIYNVDMTIAEQVRNQALQLPIAERATLARDLLVSLDVHESPEVVEAAWAEEIEARAAAYERGEMKADDWEISLERARLRLQERRQA
jgi:putative addiction module component (TIGR02574 family)